jgi:hypothetical protein
MLTEKPGYEETGQKACDEMGILVTLISLKKPAEKCKYGMIFADKGKP